MIPDFYTPSPAWPEQIERTAEMLGRISAIEELVGRAPELRRANRINSVHSSTAIEGNELSRAQVEGLANGEPVFAPPRAVKEVENALAAYESLELLDPWSVDDFLRAHELLTAGLVAEAGEFRSVDVEIVNADGDVLHTGSRVEKVPRLIGELLEWGRASADHPLVVSSATHFLIEHIHPFRDGNGRIGRLWQTLILSRWRPIFAWMPTETLIRSHQDGYYAALQASREPEIDAAAFIDYMLRIVTATLEMYEERAASATGRVGESVGDSVGVEAAIIALLRADPTLSAAALSDRVGTTSRTVERHIARLKARGLLRREGSPRAGRWVVIGG